MNLPTIKQLEEALASAKNSQRSGFSDQAAVALFLRLATEKMDFDGVAAVKLILYEGLRKKYVAEVNWGHMFQEYQHMLSHMTKVKEPFAACGKQLLHAFWSDLGRYGDAKQSFDELIALYRKHKMTPEFFRKELIAGHTWLARLYNDTCDSGLKFRTFVDRVVEAIEESNAPGTAEDRE